MDVPSQIQTWFTCISGNREGAHEKSHPLLSELATMYQMPFYKHNKTKNLQKLIFSLKQDRSVPSLQTPGTDGLLLMDS